MRLIFRSLLRNILIKPLRTAVIVLCLTAVSLSFSLCLTVNIASKRVIEDQVRRGTGKADIILSSREGFDTLPELPKGTQAVEAVHASSYLQLHRIESYKYVQKKSISVIGIDALAAAGFGMLPECVQPNDGEAVIGQEISRRFGYEVGEQLTLPCADGSQITLTVSGTVPSSNYLSNVPLTVIVSQNTAKRISCAADIAANTLYIDVTDDKRITKVSRRLAELYPDMDVQQIMGTDEIGQMISGVTSSFFIIFAVTLLMIVFIISAFSKSIAAERLSMIGTLRSIGAEKKTAAAALLIECAVYGVIGGLIGCVLFYALKDVLAGGMLPTEDGVGGSVYAPIYIPLTGLLLSAAISCIFSLGAVVRTSKTPLRDIIFGGKETVFYPPRSACAGGAAMIAVSAGLYFLRLGFAADLFSLAAFVTGVCLVIPTLLSLISKAAAEYTRGAGLPVLRLAVIQSGTKRSAVTGTVICTAAVMLTSTLYVLSRSVDRLYSARNYDCDVIITGLSERADRYRSMTSDSAEFIYHTEELVGINGGSVSLDLFGYDGFEMFSGLSGLPERLGSGEISLDRALMKRLGISEGDKLTLTLRQNTVRPVTLELTAVSGCDSVYYDMRCNAAAISLDSYKSVYRDSPSELLLKTDDAELSRRQLTDESAELTTAEEYYALSDKESGSVTMLLYGLAALGMALAVISVCGSRTIGFEQRRHELAVLRSQGMSMEQLSKMLTIESVITAAVPVIMFSVFGKAMTALMGRILGSIDLNIPICYEPAGLIVFIAVISAAVIATVLIPIRTLKGMNTAEELKQE